MKKPVLPTLGLLSLGAALGVVGNHPSLQNGPAGRPVLAALPGTATADTDGDGLPDRLEALFMTNPLVVDTDGDASSDFVEIVTGRDALQPDARSPVGNSFRVVPFSTREIIGGNEYRFVYINQLYRIAANRLEDVQALSCFLDIGGTRGLRIEATGVMLQLFEDMAVIEDVRDGLLVRVTMKVPMSGLEAIPGGSMFGTYTQITGQPKAGGGVVMFHSGIPTTIMPLPGTAQFVIQPLEPSETNGSTVWTRHRFCLFDLVVNGTSRSGEICTIVNADCSTAIDRACAPDCRASNGGIVFIPDGLAILKGG